MGEPCRLRQAAAGMDDIQEKIEDFVVEYVWDDEDGKGLGGKQFGDTVSEYWGSVSSGATTASSWSWAVGTTCAPQPPLPLCRRACRFQLSLSSGCAPCASLMSESGWLQGAGAVVTSADRCGV